MTLSLLLGFYSMLRTEELLAVVPNHLSIHDNQKSALLSLGLTKGGKRQGAAESVTISVIEVAAAMGPEPTSSIKPVSIA